MVRPQPAAFMTHTLVFAALVLGQLTEIKGPDSIPRDRLIRLEAVGSADSILWEVEPAEGADLGPDGSTAFLFVATPGRYTVRAIGATVVGGKVQLSRARRSITVGASPNPTPDPGPNPPNPDPVPPPASEAGKAGREWAGKILGAYASSLEAVANDLAAGKSAKDSLDGGNKVGTAGRLEAMRATVQPIFAAILPGGSATITDDQRKRLIVAYRDAAVSLRAAADAIPRGNR